MLGSIVHAVQRLWQRIGWEVGAQPATTDNRRFKRLTVYAHQAQRPHEVPDPAALRIQLTVNGEIRQKASAADTSFTAMPIWSRTAFMNWVIG